MNGTGGCGGNGGESGIVQVVRLRSTMRPVPSFDNTCSLPKDLATNTHAPTAKGIKTVHPIAAGARQLNHQLARTCDGARVGIALVAVPLLLVVAISPSESSS